MKNKVEWRKIPSIKGYKVSNDGRVKALTRCIVNRGKVHRRKASTCNVHKDENGYMFVRLSVKGNVKNYYVHRLVAEAWHGECPEGLEVDHINRVRDDNRPENLRYVTRAENNANRDLSKKKDKYDENTLL